MPAGRPKDINSPDELWQLFQNYKTQIKEDPILVHDFVGKDADEVDRKKERPLTMEGFENYVADNDGPHTLDQYFSNRDERYSEFVAICLRIKRVIRQDQIEGGMVGIFNTSITQRLNGLAEKTESTIKADISQIDYSKLSDAALEEIANAGSQPSQS